MDSNERINFEQIISAVKSKQCILFLGAGVHYPPKNDIYTFPPECNLPLGYKLSQELAKESGYIDDYPSEDVNNLQRVAQYIQLKNPNRWDLNNSLRKHLHDGKRPSPVLLALAELDFPLIITTNFDRLFESALRNANKNPNIIVYNKNPAKKTPKCKNFTIEEPTVFKMHGDLFFPGDADDSAVISDEDYIHFIMRMRDHGQFDPIPLDISEKIRQWPIVFIGYSLIDYNLRLLFKIMRWRKNAFPPGYSIDPRPDPIIKQIFQRDGHAHFLIQDVWNFVPDLYKIIKNSEMPDYYAAP